MIVGSCIILCFAGNHWLFAGTYFEFVPVRVLKKYGVIAGAVLRTDFRPFDFMPANVPNQFRNLIHARSFFRPESNSGAVRLMLSVLSESKKRGGLVPTYRVERSPLRVRSITSEAQRRQQL